MAGAVELATAYIALVPSMKGASQKISDELNPAAATSGAAAGEGLGRSIVGAAAKWAAPLAAAVGFGKILKTGFDEAKDAAAGTAQLAAGIESTGNAANLSVEGLNSLASEIQNYSGQTDDSIVKSEQLLQTFTNIKNNGPDKIFDLATKASADMAAKFGGDASSQAVLLGKALNDPVKGITALQRVGVSFSDSQKNTIAALMKTGDVAGAQKVILSELNTEFGGAAKAAGQSFPGQLQRLHRAFEDLSQGIVQGFLPVMAPALEGVIGILQKVGPVAAEGAQKVADFAGRIGGAVGAVFTLFKTGDFTGGIRKALGVEEDSRVVDVILNIRDAFSHLWAGLTMGPDVLASIGAPLEGLVAIGHALRAPFDFARKAMSDFFAGITMNADTVASIGVPLEGIVSVGARVRQAFSDLWAGLTMPAGVAASIGAPLTGLVAAGSGLRQTFDTIVQSVGPLIPQLFSLYASFSPLHLIFSALAPVLPQIGAALGQLGSAIGGALSSALTTVVPVLVQLSSVIVDSLGGAVQAILPALVGLIPMVAGAFAQLLPVIAGLITQLAPLIATLLPPLVGLFTSLIPVVVQLVTSVLPVAVQIITMLVQSIAPLVTILAAMLIPIIQALMPVVVMVFGIISDVITSAMQIVQGIIQVVLGIITGNWSMVWDGIVNTVSGALSLVGNVLGGLGDIVMGALDGAGSWLFNIGKDIINGLLDGIGSMVGAIGSAILSLVPGPIVGVFKAALGIQSPSRVFRALGKHIPEGLNLGIGDGADDVASTMKNLVTIPDVPTFGAPAASIASIAGSAGRSGATFNTTINQVDDPIGTAHAVTRRQLALSS